MWRVDWVGDARAKCKPEKGKEPSNKDIMLHWSPRKGGIMVLNLDTIEDFGNAKVAYDDAARIKKNPLLPAYQKTYVNNLVFRAFTVGHELVHCFITFLAGNSSMHTPVGFAPTGFGDDVRGESGRQWEVGAFGGSVSLVYWETIAPAPSVGEIWLTKDDMMAKVNPDALERMVRRKFKFPLAIVGSWINAETAQKPSTTDTACASMACRQALGKRARAPAMGRGPVPKPLQGSTARPSPGHSAARPPPPEPKTAQTVRVQVGGRSSDAAERTEVRGHPAGLKVAVPQSEHRPIHKVRAPVVANRQQNGDRKASSRQDPRKEDQQRREDQKRATRAVGKGATGSSGNHRDPSRRTGYAS
ncbi:hypothetical protein N658DRAFT_501652 [Parathielavia hyrcaniae]|uniref:Uncharacterized protein n=1 Tax=Parathielavia hyrcaniae TaxID=113614 RepID=A0AAN6SWG5_9PEZI|nr:hypothetical protein N658DRAFT_501652 [Parathielavia hyrcaniae]